MAAYSWLISIAHAEAAAESPVQAPPPPGIPQLAADVASSSPAVRRQALRSLRDRGERETLVLLARLVGDAEADIREGAVGGEIGVYVPSARTRSTVNAAAAFEAARFRAQVWPLPAELSIALVKALADEMPSIRRDAAYALGIVLSPPVTDAVAFEILASLSDREPSVRCAAALALGHLHVQAAGVALIGRVERRRISTSDWRRCARSGICARARAVVALADQFSFYVRGIAGRSALGGARGHRSPVEHPAVRSADHVTCIRRIGGRRRRPGAVGPRRRRDAARPGGDGLGERPRAWSPRWPSRWPGRRRRRQPDSRRAGRWPQRGHGAGLPRRPGRSRRGGRRRAARRIPTPSTRQSPSRSAPSAEPEAAAALKGAQRRVGIRTCP